jgi:hypothetical protein
MTLLAAPIARMVEATNAADTPAFLAAFSDDAYLEDWGRGFHGRAGAASWNETDNIGKNSHFEVLAQHDEDDTQVVTIKVTGGGYNGTGDIVFTVVGDHITRMIIS